MSIDPMSLGLAASNSTKISLITPIKTPKVHKIVVVGDSYVGGATADTPNSFADQFAYRMRSVMGNAGLGYAPFQDGGLAGAYHTGSVSSIGPTGPGSKMWPWDSADIYHGDIKKYMFGGAGYYASGITGGSHSAGYAESSTDNYRRGSTDSPTSIKLYVNMLAANTGFFITESNLNGSFTGEVYSNGASCNITTTSGNSTVTISSVQGAVPRLGALITTASALGATAQTIRTTTSSGQASSGGTNAGGAGTYVFNANASASVTNQAATFRGNMRPDLNIPQCIEYRYQPGGNRTLVLSVLYGSLAITGLEHYNGSEGVTVTNMGAGGTTAYQWSTLDKLAQIEYWRLLQPDTVIFCLGVNDRDCNEGGQYGTSMDRKIAEVRAGSPSTNIILCVQPEMPDQTTTWMPQIQSVVSGLATKWGCAVFDMRTADPNMATYALAYAAGYMSASSGVHLTGAGNIVVGDALARWYLTQIGKPVNF